MLGDFAYLRGLVFLRRIAVALERLVVLEEERVHPVRQRSPRLVDFGVMDVKAVEKNWRRANPRYDGTDDFSPDEPQ